MKEIWNGMPNAGTDINDNFKEIDSNVVHLTGTETITGPKTFKELHFSNDTGKLPLEISSDWQANAHHARMKNGVLSIYIQGIRPKKDGFTGESYPVVATLPKELRGVVNDHDIPFMWSNY
ncbi:hypothetical protein [Lactococcus petauri]|uniref:hypothetical protein n=1 Tax=Lactococcus petauri TaxID=1940789 RepID=UPI001F57927B|nr:hypothetical protein [Lactococcus petauri]